MDDSSKLSQEDDGLEITPGMIEAAHEWLAYNFVQWPETTWGQDELLKGIYAAMSRCKPLAS